MGQRLENRLGTLRHIAASCESEGHGSKLLGSSLIRDCVAQRLESELGRGQGLVVVRHTNMLLNRAGISYLLDLQPVICFVLPSKLLYCPSYLYLQGMGCCIRGRAIFDQVRGLRRSCQHIRRAFQRGQVAACAHLPLTHSRLIGFSIHEADLVNSCSFVSMNNRSRHIRSSMFCFTLSRTSWSIGML